MEAILAGSVIGDLRAAVAVEAIRRPAVDTVPVVFVIAGDVSARRSLERLIRTAGWEPAFFGSAEEFLAHPCGTAPCCLILDLTRRGLSGLELQRQLADRPDIPIIFIAGHEDVSVAVQAMKAGAVEFLSKPVDEAALTSAIGSAIERSRSALRRGAEMRLLHSAYATLTRRERDVMALVVTGLLNKQIGGELGINEVTVKAHRGQVMRKMRADSLPELVTMAMRLGLLSPENTGRHQPQSGRPYSETVLCDAVGVRRAC